MMDKHEGLIRRLCSLVIMDEVGSDNPLGRDTADAIRELVKERDNLVSVVGEHVAKRKANYDRDEKAETENLELSRLLGINAERTLRLEADLAAARAALRTTAPRVADWELVGIHAPAIVAARAEGGE